MIENPIFKDLIPIHAFVAKERSSIVPSQLSNGYRGCRFTTRRI